MEHPTKKGRSIALHMGSQEVGNPGKEDQKRCRNKMDYSIMKITIIVEKTKAGYSAYAQKYPVYTVGKSLEELKSNILEAVNLSLEKSGKSVTENDLKIVLDLPQFFESAGVF